MKFRAGKWAALVVLVTLLSGILLPAAAAKASTGSVPGPVVLLGTGGLRWSDVGDEQPALHNLLKTGSSGWLAVRSIRSSTCPVDGWLGVSAGARAADEKARDGEAVCRNPRVSVAEPGGSGLVEQWGRYVTQAQEDDFDARLGLLGDALNSSHVRSAAVGAGAAVALADSDGQASHVWAGSHQDPAALAEDVGAALSTSPQLLAVDLAPSSIQPISTIETQALSQLLLVLCLTALGAGGGCRSSSGSSFG